MILPLMMVMMCIGNFPCLIHFSIAQPEPEVNESQTASSYNTLLFGSNFRIVFSCFWRHFVAFLIFFSLSRLVVESALFALALVHFRFLHSLPIAEFTSSHSFAPTLSFSLSTLS
jgi:hypothetical protein